MIFSVLKKDNSLKLCVRYCALDKKVIQHWLEDFLKVIQDSFDFSALGLKGVYHIPMQKQHLCALTMPFDLLCGALSLAGSMAYVTGNFNLIGTY